MPACFLVDQVEGAMIPRFCQAKHVVQVHSTEDVSWAIKHAKQECQGKK